MAGFSRYPGMVLLTLVEWLLTDIPGPVGRRLRRGFWRRRLASMGRDVQIDTGVKIRNPGLVYIGDNCWLDHGAIVIAGAPSTSGGRRLWLGENPDYIGQPGEVRIGNNVHVANYTVLQGHGGLQIGNDITIASGSKIYSMSHHYSNRADPGDRTKYKFSTMSPPAEQSLIAAPVVLRDAAALGLNSVVLPGVTIGAGTWVGAGSLVNHSLPDNALAAGNPAKLIRTELIPGWSPGMEASHD